MLSCDIDWMLSCGIDWMLHFINGWKNEWMLDVNEECRVSMLGGGGGAKGDSTFTWLALFSREY